MYNSNFNNLHTVNISPTTDPSKGNSVHMDVNQVKLQDYILNDLSFFPDRLKCFPSYAQRD